MQLDARVNPGVHLAWRHMIRHLDIMSQILPFPLAAATTTHMRTIPVANSLFVVQLSLCFLLEGCVSALLAQQKAGLRAMGQVLLLC